MLLFITALRLLLSILIFKQPGRDCLPDIALLLVSLPSDNTSAVVKHECVTFNVANLTIYIYIYIYIHICVCVCVCVFVQIRRLTCTIDIVGKVTVRTNDVYTKRTRYSYN